VPNPAQLFLVDDHQIVLDGLLRILSELEGISVIGQALNGKEALEKIPTLRPDLVLMDLDMPVMNGLDAATQLLKTLPDLKIVILTMHREESLVKKMMEIGVQGFFIKNTDQEELLLGIRQVLKGKKYFHYEALTPLVQSTPLAPNTLELNRLSQLSEREREVLLGIARGLTSQQIGEELFISTRTVETHRKNIHAKLEIKNLAGLIRFAIKAGLVS